MLKFLLAVSTLIFSSSVLAQSPKTIVVPNESELFTYTRADVICVGVGNVGREYIAFKADRDARTSGFKLSRDGSFSIVGYLLQMPGLEAVGDRESELKILKNDQAKVDLNNPIALENCSPELSLIRTLGKERYVSLPEYRKYVPYQEGCTASHYNICVDQRQTVIEATDKARSQGKYLLLVAGYSGCVWCDNMLNYLSHTTAITDRFWVQSLAMSSENRTGSFVTQSLADVSDFPQISSGGVPLLFLINPSNSKVAAIHPESMEDGYSYFFDQVKKAISAKLDVIK